jgi:hypothetical protein
MLALKVTYCEGRTAEDLVLALQEMIRLIEGGFTSGMNSNEDGKFGFEVNGEEEEGPHARGSHVAMG